MYTGQAPPASQADHSAEVAAMRTLNGLLGCSFPQGKTTAATSAGSRKAVAAEFQIREGPCPQGTLMHDPETTRQVSTKETAASTSTVPPLRTVKGDRRFRHAAAQTRSVGREGDLYRRFGQRGSCVIASAVRWNLPHPPCEAVGRRSLLKRNQAKANALRCRCLAMTMG